MRRPVHEGSPGHDEEHSKDAMGLDKRRSVVGGQYSASLAKQLTVYGVAFAVGVALFIGAVLLVGELDKAPETYPDEAPWSQSDAAQTPAAQLE